MGRVCAPGLQLGLQMEPDAGSDASPCPWMQLLEMNLVTGHCLLVIQWILFVPTIGAHGKLLKGTLVSNLPIPSVQRWCYSCML